MSSETQRIERLQDAMARSRGTASSSDGSVTVVVGANGVLYSIELGDAAARLTVHQLADVVVELHKVAFAQAGAAVREAVEQLRDSGSDASSPEGDETPAAGAAESHHPLEEHLRPAAGDHVRSDSYSDTRADADTGAWSARDTYSPSRARGASDSGSALKDDASQHESMAHVIQPFDSPDDEDFYFTATPEPPPPRRAPRRVEVARADRADDSRDSLCPNLLSLPDDRQAVDARTGPSQTVEDPVPIPAWLEPQFPESDRAEDDRYELDDHWGDWEVGRH